MNQFSAMVSGAVGLTVEAIYLIAENSITDPFFGIIRDCADSVSDSFPACSALIRFIPGLFSALGCLSIMNFIGFNSD